MFKNSLLQKMLDHESRDVRKLALCCLYGPMLYRLNLLDGSIVWKSSADYLLNSKNSKSHDIFLNRLTKADLEIRLKALEECKNTKKETVAAYNMMVNDLSVEIFENFNYLEEEIDGKKTPFIFGLIQATPNCKAITSLEVVEEQSREEKLLIFEKLNEKEAITSTQPLALDKFKEAVNINLAKTITILQKRIEILKKEEEFDESSVHFHTMLVMGLGNRSNLFVRFGFEAVKKAEHVIQSVIQSMIGSEGIQSCLENGMMVYSLNNMDRWKLLDFIESFEEKMAPQILSEFSDNEGVAKPFALGAAYIYPHFGTFADQMIKDLNQTLNTIDQVNQSHIAMHIGSINTGSVYKERPENKEDEDKSAGNDINDQEALEDGNELTNHDINTQEALEDGNELTNHDINTQEALEDGNELTNHDINTQEALEDDEDFINSDKNNKAVDDGVQNKQD